MNSPKPSVTKAADSLVLTIPQDFSACIANYPRLINARANGGEVPIPLSPADMQALFGAAAECTRLNDNPHLTKAFADLVMETSLSESFLGWCFLFTHRKRLLTASVQSTDTPATPRW